MGTGAELGSANDSLALIAGLFERPLFGDVIDVG